jgi:O-antigen/teichoic acid export membrane protein
MNSPIIAKNSFWYGLETFINLFLTMFTSIAIARSIGPEKLGHFIYLWWIAGVAGTLGSLGIPAATKKYMSEYFGRCQMGIARAVFYKTLRLQAFVAAGITLVSLILVWFLGDRQYRLIALLMMGSIFPFMVNSIAAGANTALEDLRANVLPSLISSCIFIAAVFSSLHFGWNLTGISVGLLAMRTVELLVRMVPLMKRLNRHPLEQLDRILTRRMLLFSSQSLILLVISLIVWDRSEMIVLKNFCVDVRQVAFYSVAFNITERLLVFSQVFATATGATVMVQYGRDAARIPGLVNIAVRYLALISFPVHLGLAAIAGPVMWIIYGTKYSGAVPTLVICACLGIPKAFLLPVQATLSSCERQDLIIRWGLLSSALNLLLDFLLIPRFGSVGAALANGTTQTFSALVLWWAAAHLLAVRLPVAELAKTAAISAAMAIGVHLATTRVSAVPATIMALIIGALVYLILVRVTRILGPDDYGRMLSLKPRVPSGASSIFEASLNWLIPTQTADV